VISNKAKSEAAKRQGQRAVAAAAKRKEA